jgi:hypothetical protein
MADWQAPENRNRQPIEPVAQHINGCPITMRPALCELTNRDTS